jgi:nitrite reductase/ring-hydroxylating ferredoxin subunit
MKNNREQNHRGIALCRVDAIEDPGSRGFDADQTGLPWGLFVVHKNGEWFAYRNHCPHTGAPLDWMPDQFLDREKAFVQCAMHGALFRVDDGFCLLGPCAGQTLESLPIRVEEGEIWLERPRKDPPRP